MKCDEDAMKCDEDAMKCDEDANGCDEDAKRMCGGCDVGVMRFWGCWGIVYGFVCRKKRVTMDKKDYVFEERFVVRDYECDLQGIVNNANYQHYTEHARHRFLLSRGVDFAALHARGIDAVVAKIAIEYKKSLRSGDEFVCKLFVAREGIRYVFYQDIYRADGALCAKARVDTVVTVDGKLVMGVEDLDAILD